MSAIAAAAALLAHPAAAQPVRGDARLKADRCSPGAGTAAGRVGSARVRPLGTEPPAQHLYALYRLDENGCSRPVVLRGRVAPNREAAPPLFRSPARPFATR